MLFLFSKEMTDRHLSENRYIIAHRRAFYERLVIETRETN